MENMILAAELLIFADNTQNMTLIFPKKIINLPFHAYTPFSNYISLVFSLKRSSLTGPIFYVAESFYHSASFVRFRNFPFPSWGLACALRVCPSCQGQCITEGAGPEPILHPVSDRLISMREKFSS